jgi:hypothetical protein
MARERAEKERFNRYSRYLIRRYGKKVYRVAVDAGFTCPHRLRGDGSGCSFCDEDGSRAVYQQDPEQHGSAGEDAAQRTAAYSRKTGGLHQERFEAIRSQIQEGTRFLHGRYGAETFILYLQAFSNTFAQPRVLSAVYDYALSCADFRELIVSTRPDCIAPAHAELLAEYRSGNREVWTELGLQSAHEATLRRIGRGHTLRRFERAVGLLRERGIKVTVHLMFGLPGEGRREMMETVRYLAQFEPDGVKVHNLHVAAGTQLAREYLRGELSVPSLSRHLEYVAEALRYLPPQTVVQRVTCDTADAKRIAPRTVIPKGEFYSLLDKLLSDNDIRQGDLYRSGEAGEEGAVRNAD